MEPQSLQRKKILFVEDEESMLNALVDSFKREGVIEVLTARNGEDGLALALKEHPDLLLVDILMPKMDGLTMLKRVREDEWGKMVKVIVLTNFDTDDEMLKKVSLAEPAFYLLKSNWSMEDVILKSKEVLGLL
ncbi:MAG: two-component system, sporulation family, response regulator, stage 0 sporulation protein A [Candidatus Wolfebacteria bacterium GW2011_GWE1_48_7]|uniref:Two-component system, sporulation family, response regulator, stage 0 sporulation protein A n=2 Tax=Candidatus Wolfeibacteriota TaxID=1752735 RepID=A0A0G1U7Q5_9BACT|nr:MAG: hypothetical protein UX70_C0001G0714 [Candidatus Wolfebacteria bacterium GW2011_GWB1_47_1]KKU36672.1 MAG: two-component system, sporulation family, response regulator, stage 0 sporulation protein A [Candidatus Wolfebacteria bacterium GW2011_GWC2_46_275]KKU42364.1 MAG: two-component system, sporulation family, response regulator, stage 0 sporulation protein A [Candidatus Wolfebacteria bacterium GW2011_GWB2_46_69]KKU54330.1 MAG: two-component system, sporulation family, response regulator,